MVKKAGTGKATAIQFQFFIREIPFCSLGLSTMTFPAKCQAIETFCQDQFLI
jgi:hypothetical protein